MESKVIVYIVIGIIVGAALGFGGSLGIYTQQITPLRGQLNEAESKYSSLSVSYSNLSVSYSNLSNEKNDLQNRYQNLQSDNTLLQSKFTSLQNDYNSLSAIEKQTVSYLKQLSSNVTKLRDIFESYYSYPEAFKRTLNDAEIKKVGSTVSTLATSSTDTWTALNNIYNYIVNNVNYRCDTSYPHISSWIYVNYDGTEVWTQFKISTIEDFVQTPDFTLTKKQGDCDCQAVLEYAMIMYYYRYITSKVYNTYLTEMEFSDGTGHSSVFIPVQNGQLCIIDTVSRYKTSEYGPIGSKVASTELDYYQNIFSEHGSITKMTLYKVNTVDGSAVEVAEGSLTNIKTFLSR